MTRINVVPPAELCDKHLVAEYRELPRIFQLIRNRLESGKPLRDDDTPTEYVLGKGHVKFFYDKPRWLLRRQAELVAEMRRRGFRPKFEADDGLLAGIPCSSEPEWVADERSKEVNRERIRERLNGMLKR